ncbi:MAG TPA: extracellular solute-binding protein [Firmicutes bacterium]|nr:extracellular solute-binding protein [Bacillota bacterium]
MKHGAGFRKTLVLTLACLALFFGGTFSSLAAETTLTVWVYSTGTQKEYQFVADLFEKQNPGIKVDVQLQSGGQPEVMQKLMLSIAAGTPPDVSWIEGSGVIEFAAQGLLMDVSRAVEGLKFTPADVVEMTYQGKMWAVPYHTAVRGLFKRADIFQEVGLNPNIDPADLDELYEWNKKLVKQNPDGSFSRGGIIPWTGNWGAPRLDLDFRRSVDRNRRQHHQADRHLSQKYRSFQMDPHLGSVLWLPQSGSIRGDRIPERHGGHERRIQQ